MENLTTLHKQAKKQVESNNKRFLTNLKELETVEKILANRTVKQLLTDGQYTKAKEGAFTPKELRNIIVDRLNKKTEKKLAKIFKTINEHLHAGAVKSMTCSIEWGKSRTWGACPHGNYRNCYEYKEYGAITGCNYDKLSTLTAEMFNDDVYLIGLIAKYCIKKHINRDNIRTKLGCGINMYEGIPYFEGGVGVSCHVSILKKIGFTVNFYSGNHYNYIEVDRTKAIEKLNTYEV